MAPPYPGPAPVHRRRGWARVQAVGACLLGVSVFALTAAALVVVAAAGVARGWSWVTGEGIEDAPVWAWAPGGAGAIAALAVVVSFGGAFWWFWVGARRSVLREVHAVPLDPSQWPQLHNVVEALSIGLGKPMPSLHVVHDTVPNALSLRSTRSRSLCVTTGCSALTRDEVEAMCAHELAHLWAADAHWVTSGMVSLARARRFGGWVLGLGVALGTLVFAALEYADVFLWSTAAVAVVLVVLGWLARTVLRRLEVAVRRHADEIADVMAVKLARNPQSLGMVCARLAANHGRVRRVGWRSELLWFEAVEELDLPAELQDPSQVQAHRAMAAEANARSQSELVSRAVRAYAEARVPLPPEVQALR
jgi:heat shock protein HtpX